MSSASPIEQDPDTNVETAFQQNFSAPQYSEKADQEEKKSNNNQNSNNNNNRRGSRGATPPPSENGNNSRNSNDNSYNNKQSSSSSPASPASPASPTAKTEIFITMNNPKANEERGYPDNFIKTYKYEWYSFFFVNLFYQFLKVSNFFFLLNAVFSLVPGVSPFSPIVSIAPLLFVVGVAMLKDGYEDVVRHIADAEANSIKATVVRPCKEDEKRLKKFPDATDIKYELTEVESRDVRVGDIMRVKNGEEVRADLLLLSSTGNEGSSFIDTCNLDGETNLKNRKSCTETLYIKDVESAVNMTKSLEIKTTEPSPALLHWGGVVYLEKTNEAGGVKEDAVGIDQFLYRSCILKNTEEAWGVVLYAGVDTKMFRNLEERPPKMSNLDVKLNWLIFAVIVIEHVLLFIQAGIAIAFNNSIRGHWYGSNYVKEESDGSVGQNFSLWGFRYLSYFILMSYMIPISLFVTIELCKVAQAKLMEWDHEMMEWMHGKWQHCTANTSNLNEQLSDVKFIFSDKTGTLTENVMRYSLGDALGVRIDADDFEKTKDIMAGRAGSDEDRSKLEKYMYALGLCHTVQPFDDEDSPSGLKYDGPSPDELALVETAKLHGIELRDRFTKEIKVRVGSNNNNNNNTINDEIQEFQILATLEFTPDRKMMSIVVKNPKTDKIELYTKGADSFVMDRLSQDNNVNSPQDLETTNDTLREMAETGLRTLMVCYREISQQEFDQWNENFIEAGKSLDERSKRVDEVCLQLEKDLRLIGVTAIEDKLQDKVPETLQFLLAANIVVWMLTGDKRETALTIAETSTLTDSRSFYVDQIDIGSLKMHDPKAVEIVRNQLEEVKKHVEEKDKAEQEGTEVKRVTFVIDGPALTVAMDEELMELFIEVSLKVNSAVCCRLTPLQKANVVKMFQTQTGTTALAIGDGANDVSMISEGRVGVGIVGLEGAQAALAADYAIPRFKHLRRLIAVHGRYALARNALCIIFSFYKNFLIATTLALYSFHSGLSGISVYDGWLLTMYNIILTSLPPGAVGFFEKDAPEHLLEEKPKLYSDLRKGLYFGTSQLATWFLESVVHGIVIFYIFYPFLQAQDFSGVDGRRGDLIAVSTVMYSSIIAMVLVKLGLHIRYWQIWIILAYAATLIMYFAFMAIYASFTIQDGSSVFYSMSSLVWGEAKFWLYMLLSCFGLLAIDCFAISIDRHFINPSVLYTESQHDNEEEENNNSGEKDKENNNTPPHGSSMGNVLAVVPPGAISPETSVTPNSSPENSNTIVSPSTRPAVNDNNDNGNDNTNNNNAENHSDDRLEETGNSILMETIVSVTNRDSSSASHSLNSENNNQGLASSKNNMHFNNQ